MLKGVDRYKDKLVEILVEVVNFKVIYERNDVRVREIEGFDLRKGFLYGSLFVEVEIEENGIKMIVDIENG